MQSEYINSMLSRFNMKDCNPVVMPVDKGSHLQDGESAVYKNKKMYQALVGSLTYAVMSTCPDIGYITQFLSQANKNPSQQDWNTAKRVLRYLKGTRELGIVFRRDPGMGQAEHNPATPWGYCDANYAEDPHDWKSTSSYMFMLAGSSISWKSKKQPSISLCTTEAEYYTLGIACQEVEWIRQICLKLLMPLNGPIHIYLDNTGAVALSENPVFHSRLKHIDLRWNFI